MIQGEINRHGSIIVNDVGMTGVFRNKIIGISMVKNSSKQKTGNQNRLDVAQVARHLNVSRSSVYRLIHAGELKAAAFGPVKGFNV